MADAESQPPALDAPAEPDRPPAPPTWAELVARLVPDRRRLPVAVSVALLVVGAAVAGYALLRTPPAPATELLLPYAPGAGGVAGERGPDGAGASATTITTEVAELVVQAAGAVLAPGVHRMPPGSRVVDLLTAAGGAGADADLDRVNLAALLVDGQRVWFPRIGEAEPPAVAGDSDGDGTPASEDGGGPVDLNTATAEQLDALPGVGPTIAAAIVEHRQRNGPFRTVEDLLDVPGIGEAKLAQLRDLVSV